MYKYITVTIILTIILTIVSINLRRNANIIDNCIPNHELQICEFTK